MEKATFIMFNSEHFAVTWSSETKENSVESVVFWRWGAVCLLRVIDWFIGYRRPSLQCHNLLMPGTTVTSILEDNMVCLSATTMSHCMFLQRWTMIVLLVVPREIVSSNEARSFVSPLLCGINSPDRCIPSPTPLSRNIHKIPWQSVIPLTTPFHARD